MAAPEGLVAQLASGCLRAMTTSISFASGAFACPLGDQLEQRRLGLRARGFPSGAVGQRNVRRLRQPFPAGLREPTD